MREYTSAESQRSFCARWLAWLVTFVSRFTGRAYPVSTIKERQLRHGRKGAHIEAEWTMWEHWAHNNYERGHLPQLCVRASGRKARILALVFWPKPPWKP